MDEDTLVLLRSQLDEGEGVEVDAALAEALGAEGVEGDGTTTSISEDEADGAIGRFAEKLSLPLARKELLKLLDAPYERKLEFIAADDWVVVVPLSDSVRNRAQPPKCTRVCEQVCDHICNEVCRTVCRRVPGGSVVCEPVCGFVCHQSCKRICQVVCN